MLLLRRPIFSQKGVGIQCFSKQSNSYTFCPMGTKIISEKSDLLEQQKINFLTQLRRPLHVTAINRDIETGLKALGAGIAATGVAGSGVGLGIIFGNLLSALARNPSIANKAFTNAVMGAAFCESLGLFALTIAFIILA